MYDLENYHIVTASFYSKPLIHTNHKPYSKRLSNFTIQLYDHVHLIIVTT